MITKKGGRIAIMMTVIIIIGSYQLPLSAQDRDLDEPVAEINETILTRMDLDREFRLLSAQIPANEFQEIPGDGIPDESILLEKLIDRELLIQQALKKEIRVTTSMVNVRLKRLKNQFENEQQFRDAVEKTGLTMEEIRAIIEKGLMIEQLLENDVFRYIFVSKAEAQTYYEEQLQQFTRPVEVRASHIIIRAPAETDGYNRSTAMNKIIKIIDRLQAGDNFSALAIEYSDGPNRHLGGDLGYFSKSEIIEPVSDEAFSLYPGDVSRVIETEYGFHLIKVMDRKPVRTLPFESVREEIQFILEDEKQKTAAGKYIARLKKKAVISRFLE